MNQSIKNKINNKEMLFLISGIFILIIIGIKWSIGLSQHMDILFGDEAEYMRNGLDFPQIIRNDWGPSYNLWYKFLSIFITDKISLYNFNYIFGSIVVTVLLYILLFTLSIEPFISLYISFCFFVSSIDINTWPRISHFVLMMILTSFIIISRINSTAKKILVLSITFYICSYARPDLFIIFFILLLSSFYFIYKEKNKIKSLIPYLILLVAVIIFFQFVFGFPSATYKNGLNRLYSAFCQHYSMNYRYRTGIKFDAVTEWIEFCKLKFPDCYTISDVIKNHPGDFFQHVFFNLKNYGFILLNTILSFIFPTGIFRSKKALLLAALMLTFIITYIFLQKEKSNHFIFLLKKNAFILFILFIFGIPSIGMSTIIFPRPHYILLHSIFFIILISILLQSIFKEVKSNNKLFIIAALILIFIAPNAKHYKYMQFGKDMENLCDQKLIRFLEIKKDKKYTVFTNYLNITYILPKNYHEFSTEFELKKGMSFDSILKQRNINVILVSTNILQNPILVKDSIWNQLIAKPENFNFKKFKYSDNCESYLLIKE